VEKAWVEDAHRNGQETKPRLAAKKAGLTNLVRAGQNQISQDPISHGKTHPMMAIAKSLVFASNPSQNQNLCQNMVQNQNQKPMHAASLSLHIKPSFKRTPSLANAPIRKPSPVTKESMASPIGQNLRRLNLAKPKHMPTPAASQNQEKEKPKPARLADMAGLNGQLWIAKGKVSLMFSWLAVLQ
jgi:hypothetical protein